MSTKWGFVALWILVSTPAVSGPFSDCQLEATRQLATALLMNDVAAMAKAVEKQGQCRNLVTAEDQKQVELQDRMNKLVRDAVDKGWFDPL